MKNSRKLVSDNPRQVLRILLNRIGYPYTTELYDTMLEHPDFPSFLSFHYLLKRIGIENAALRVGYQELMDTMPMPAIVYVTTNVELFLVIERVDEKGVYVLNEGRKEEFIAREDFLKMWQGNVLILDAENIPEAPRRKYQQRADSVLAAMREPFLIFSGICILVCLLFVSGPRDWLSWLFLLVSAVGIGVSILLLITQFDKNNTFVKKLCTSKKEKSKRDCSSILDSKDAYFIGLFSWSDIGFVYFTALFIIVLLLPYEGVVIAMLVSLPAFCYVFYSIIYQKFIARSWCTLCLAVQAVLGVLFVVSVFFTDRIDIKVLLQRPVIAIVLAVGLGVTAAYIAIKPLLRAKAENVPLLQAYKLLKHDEEVKEALIAKQMAIATENFLPVRIGNSAATSIITIAFGPLCQPCMRELQILIPFLKLKTDTLFEVFFIFDNKKNKEAAVIASRLLNLYINKPEMFLDELERYAKAYPVSRYKKQILSVENAEDIYRINEIIGQHEAWRKAHKIHSTPVLFFNHKRLPTFFTAKDIDYMCS